VKTVEKKDSGVETVMIRETKTGPMREGKGNEKGSERDGLNTNFELSKNEKWKNTAT
jgi:hypothetical protein